MTGPLIPAEGPAVWLGSEIDYRAAGLHVLSDADIAEIDAALAHVNSLGAVDIPALTPAMFPLDALGPTLRRLGDRLRDGPGFVLLRGLPRERYELDDLARIYAGIGVHIGRLLPQSHHGELLGHVIDVSDIEHDARGYHSGGAQSMHTDTCDIVSLMCVRAAKSGGASRIVSAGAVHNRLLETRPDLLAELYGEIVCRRWKLDADLGSGVHVKKVVFFSRATGRLSCNLSGSYPRRAVEFGDTVMSPRFEAALDELQRLARSPEFHLDMAIGEGDIQFLNNRVILHGRTAFENWPEVARRRHLMRLWLELPNWPAMPANQGMHTADDHRGWLRQRTPFMEVPTRYLAAMTQRKAELAA
jgi:Taurine catabolism dioxygenase TauD, TfdA family